MRKILTIELIIIGVVLIALFTLALYRDNQRLEHCKNIETKMLYRGYPPAAVEVRECKD